MKQYYFNDGTSQQGPFTLEELKGKNISPETPVWYDGLPDWTTAGQLEELKDIFVHSPPPFHAVTPTAIEEVKPATTVDTTIVQPPPAAGAAVMTTAAPVATTIVQPPPAAAAATVMTTAAPAKPAKKSTAWLSYVLALLVCGGTGYFIYQELEKDKGNGSNVTATIPTTDSSANNTNVTAEQPSAEQPGTTITTNADTSGHEVTTEPATTTTPVTAEPAAVTTNTTITVPATTTKTPPSTTSTTKTVTAPAPSKPDAATVKAQKAEAQKLAQKKADEINKKKLLAEKAAAEAAALKEKEYRNNWNKFIIFGKLDYTIKDDGVEPFSIPVFNGTNAVLDKVTIKVDYMKKEKKVLKSEIIYISNVPPGGGLNGKALGYKKGNNVKVYFTEIVSKKLHFCYPINNGNAADPYFCN